MEEDHSRINNNNNPATGIFNQAPATPYNPNTRSRATPSAPKKKKILEARRRIRFKKEKNEGRRKRDMTDSEEEGPQVSGNVSQDVASLKS